MQPTTKRDTSPIIRDKLSGFLQDPAMFDKQFFLLRR